MEQTLHILQQQMINSISEDADGNIFVATNAGVSVFDGVSWSEYLINGMSGSYVSEIFTDSQGRIWFGGQNYMFDGTNWHDLSAEGLHIWVHDIDEDLSGNVWLTGAQSLFKYDGQLIEYTPADGLIPGQRNFAVESRSD